MKFIHLSCIALIGITVVSIPATASSTGHNSMQRFSQWCKSKHTLPRETKHTIRVLLQKAGTSDCDRAERKLSKRRVLDLSSHKISDLSPLAQLTNLTELYLSYNKISDLSPLARLTNLNFLFLESNQVKDLSPLSQLTHLTWLFVGGNPIENKTCPVKPESVCEFDTETDREILEPELEYIA